LLAQHRADDKRQTWEDLSVNMALRLNNIYGWSIPVTLTQLSIAMQETEWAFLKVSGDYKPLTFQESVPFRTQGHSEVLDTWQELSDKLRPSAASALAGNIKTSCVDRIDTMLTSNHPFRTDAKRCVSLGTFEILSVTFTTWHFQFIAI
jgi:hypothetical protein